MAIRTTEAAVRTLIGAAPTSAEITQYIADASLWVDENLVGACSDLTDSTLELVERLLAADFSTLKYPMRKAKRIEGTAEDYSGRGTDEASAFALKAAQVDPCGVVQDRLLAGDKVRGKALVGEGYAITGGGT